MLHHVSISAIDPQRVAIVLGEILQGMVAPFPPHPGSYAVVTGDQYGTMIEVYPLGSQILPGMQQEQAVFSLNPHPYRYTETHIALSVGISEAEIEQIGAREGWRVLRCSREDCFEVIEFWLENRLMVELLPSTIVDRYLNFMRPESLAAFMSATETAPEVRDQALVVV